MSTTSTVDLDARFRIGNALRIIERDRHAIVSIDTQHCRAEIALHGAQVLSWQPARQADLLWCAPLPPPAIGKAIRGGIPICWPWFGPHASDPRQPQHGLVRTLPWRLAATSEVSAGIRVVFEIEKHGASVRLVLVAGTHLNVALTTENIGTAPLPISEALHTYFQVGDIDAIAVHGLDGCSYRDNTDGGRVKVWHGVCRMPSETIAVFDQTPDVVEIVDPVLRRRVLIKREGGLSTIVWHPGAAVSALKDVAAGTEKYFACVESGNVGASAVTIAPRAAHRLAVTYEIDAL